MYHNSISKQTEKRDSIYIHALSPYLMTIKKSGDQRKDVLQGKQVNLQTTRVKQI